MPPLPLQLLTLSILHLSRQMPSQMLYREPMKPPNAVVVDRERLLLQPTMDTLLRARLSVNST